MDLKKKRTFTWKGQNFEAVLAPVDNRYFVYLVDDLGQRVKNRDLYPDHATPDRALSCTAKITADQETQVVARLHDAAGRLLQKAQPYLDLLEKETLWDVFLRVWPDLAAYHAHLPGRQHWAPGTAKQYYNQYCNHLQPLYQHFSLPFSSEAAARFALQFENRFSENAKLYNSLLGRHESFFDYLRTHGFALGADYVLHYRELSYDDCLQSRFAIVRSLGHEFRRKLAARLLCDVWADRDYSAYALGLLLLLFAGLRPAEAQGLTYGDIDLEHHYFYLKCQRGGRKTKTTNAYRYVPMVIPLEYALRHRINVVCSALSVDDVPAACPLVCGPDYQSCASVSAFYDYARDLFDELGLKEQILLYYQNLLDKLPEFARNEEKTAQAYILRRDFISRLYFHHLNFNVIEYLSAHARSESPDWMPTIDDLEPARHCMNQFWIAQGFTENFMQALVSGIPMDILPSDDSSLQ